MLKLYSYVLDHDLGLAPNPFWGYCTLAVCKPEIRKSNKLNVGDWIIGTGSKSIEDKVGGKFRGKLIYAMEVNETLAFEDYWNDQRFQDKRPIIPGSLVKMYGDNMYYQDAAGLWNQLNSAHSHPDGSTNQKHLDRDIGGKRVVVSSNFYYFGNKAPFIGRSFRGLVRDGIGQKKVTDVELIEKFKNWLWENYNNGIHGDPINWNIYRQTNFLEKI